MKLAKIQSEVIRAYLKDENKARKEFPIYCKGDVYYITYKGVLIYKIDHKNFYLSDRLIDKIGSLVDTISDLFNNSQYALHLNYDHTTKLRNKKTVDVYSLEDKEGEFVAVDQKLIKNFENPTFRGTKYNNPVYVYEEDNLVGVVFPIRRF